MYQLWTFRPILDTMKLDVINGNSWINRSWINVVNEHSSIKMIMHFNKRNPQVVNSKLVVIVQEQIIGHCWDWMQSSTKALNGNTVLLFPGEYILLETSSEESADSGCEADNLPAEEQAEGVPFSLDKALGFARYDSNDFDEVSRRFFFLSSYLVGLTFRSERTKERHQPWRLTRWSQTVQDGVVYLFINQLKSIAVFDYLLHSPRLGLFEHILALISPREYFFKKNCV